jgi:hypothetical protein
MPIISQSQIEFSVSKTFSLKSVKVQLFVEGFAKRHQSTPLPKGRVSLGLTMARAYADLDRLSKIGVTVEQAKPKKRRGPAYARRAEKRREMALTFEKNGLVSSTLPSFSSIKRCAEKFASNRILQKAVKLLPREAASVADGVARGILEIPVDVVTTTTYVPEERVESGSESGDEVASTYEEALARDLGSTDPTYNAQLQRTEALIREAADFLGEYNEEIADIRRQQAELGLLQTRSMEASDQLSVAGKAAFLAALTIKSTGEVVSSSHSFIRAAHDVLSLTDRFVPSGATTVVVSAFLASMGVSVAGVIAGTSITVAPFTGPFAPLVLGAGGLGAASVAGISSGVALGVSGARLGYEVMHQGSRIALDVASASTNLAVGTLGLTSASLGIASWMSRPSSSTRLSQAELQLRERELSSRHARLELLAQSRFELEVRRRGVEWALRSAVSHGAELS